MRSMRFGTFAGFDQVVSVACFFKGMARLIGWRGYFATGRGFDIIEACFVARQLVSAHVATMCTERRE